MPRATRRRPAAGRMLAWHSAARECQHRAVDAPGRCHRGARGTPARGAARDRRRTTSPPTSRSAPRRWSSGTTWASRPATIRNDMAVLEDEGYITQPHTSAGRIPTDKGYRLFVDRLSAVKPLSVAERRAIETLPRRRGRPRRRAAPHRPAAGPADPAGRRRAVPDAVPLGGPPPRGRARSAATRLLLVLITDTGRVEQRVVELPVRRRRRRRSPTCARCSTPRCAGRRLAERRRARSPTCSTPRRRSCAPLVGAVTRRLLETLVEQPRGAAGARRHRQPHPRRALDFPGTVRPVLEALEEQVVLLRLLGEVGRAGTVLVRIGEENASRRCRSTSRGVGRLRHRRPGAGRPRRARPDPDGLPGQHGRGARRRPLRRPTCWPRAEALIDEATDGT